MAGVLLVTAPAAPSVRTASAPIIQAMPLSFSQGIPPSLPSPSASGCISSHVGTTCLSAAALATWCYHHSRHVRPVRRRLRRRAVVRRSGPDEVEALQLEASRLRAEVDAFKTEKEEQRAREQERSFSAFDKDGSGAVDLQELRDGLQEYWSIELDEAMAAKLLAVYDSNKDGLLEQKEFDLGRMRATYDKLREESRVKEAAEEKRSKECAQRQAILEEYLSKLPEPNEDTGLFTRVGSMLTYLLPLLDSVLFAKPLASQLPQLEPLYAAFASGPYGLAPWILYAVFQGLANNTDLPKLLRFNMRQSVLLNVSLLVPIVIGAVASSASKLALGTTNEWGEWTPGKVPQDISDPCNLAVFALLLACILYSMASSLLGRMPVGIPIISQRAERTMAKTRDSETEARLQRQLQEAEQLSEEKEKAALMK